MKNQALLDEIRAAFEGNDIFQMRRALRKAHDLVTTLTVDGNETAKALGFYTTFYEIHMKNVHNGFWNFDHDTLYQSALVIVDTLKDASVE